MKNEIENLVDSSAELRDEVQGLRRLANGETSLQEKTALGATAVQVAATNAWDTTVKAAKVASAAPSFGKEGIKDVAQAAQEHVAEQAKVTAATSAIIHGAAKAMQIPAAPLPVKVFGKSVEVVNGMATGTAIADMKKQVEESVPGPVREKLGEIGPNG
ncbi:hypothetical protein AACH06_15045 [Ideonella sp. DXS29W]|uniref:Uncharacterized protein n=1 Tax=Ideonella lacteola TaxID=2984193 RepID=A0ABU9BQA8_9BURK